MLLCMPWSTKLAHQTQGIAPIHVSTPTALAQRARDVLIGPDTIKFVLSSCAANVDLPGSHTVLPRLNRCNIFAIQVLHTWGLPLPVHPIFAHLAGTDGFPPELLTLHGFLLHLKCEAWFKATEELLPFYAPLPDASNLWDSYDFDQPHVA